MKKLVLFLTTLALLFAACSKLRTVTSVHHTPLITKSTNTPYVVTEPMARAFVSFAYPEKQIKTISQVQEGFKPLLWVINFDDGWVIISGDKRTNIVLSQCEEGEYVYGNSIPPVDVWMAGYANEVKEISQSDWEGDTSSLSIWDAVWPIPIEIGHTTKADEQGPIWVRTLLCQVNTLEASEITPHLLDTKWGQHFPWNENVPYYLDSTLSPQHFPAGCFAVSVGQILYYLHYKDGIPNGLYETVYNYHYLPSGGMNNNFQHSNYVNNSNRWDYMANEYPSIKNYSYVADFLGDLGHAINVSYGINGSYAPFLPSAFTQLGLTCSNSVDFDFSTAFTEISNDYPVAICAAGYENMIAKYHAFVADGNITNHYRIDTYYEWHVYPDMAYIVNNNIPVYFYLTDEEMQTYDPDMYDGKQTMYSHYSTDTYLYMNWGYNGDYDNVLCGPISSLHHWSSNLNYDFDRTMIYNIR